MHFATETQHTDCSHHYKDFEGKEWNVLLLLLTIKKALKTRHRTQKKLQRHKAIESFLRDGRSRMIQEKQRQIQLSSCKSYTCTHTKSISQKLVDPKVCRNAAVCGSRYRNNLWDLGKFEWTSTGEFFFSCGNTCPIPSKAIWKHVHTFITPSHEGSGRIFCEFNNS